MTGGINDIDPVVFPAGRDGGSRNRDAALPFLFHPVGDGGTVVNLTHLVYHPGVEKNPFGSGGFSRVNVGGDADISDAVQWKGAGHEGGLREVKKTKALFYRVGL